MLLFVSGSFVSLSLASMGTFFYMQKQWGDAKATAELGWLPLLSLIVFFIAFSGGFSNVPLILMGELFPARFRNLLGSVSSSFNLLCTFIVVRSFPDMQTNMTKHGTFWFFMCCTLCSIVFTFFLLPETKGRTLEDIEKLFSKKYNKDGTLKNPTEEMNSQTTEIVGPTNTIIEQTDVKKNNYVNVVYYQSNSNEISMSVGTVDSEDEEEDDGVPVPTPL